MVLDDQSIVAHDLCLAAGTLVLETSVVVVTGTDAGKVVACIQISLSIENSLLHDWVFVLSIRTVPPQVAEGGSQTCTPLTCQYTTQHRSETN